MRIEVTEGGRGQRVAPFGIQANVVAPNYLYSEMYYPKARFVDSAEGRELIAITVPFGRSAAKRGWRAHRLLACGKSPLTAGQVIHSTALGRNGVASHERH